MSGRAATTAPRELLVQAAATAAMAADRAGVVIRPLETLDQMQAACVVLNEVWGIGPGQASEIQPHLLRALGHGGNYLVGAYGADGEPVGASVSFFTEPLGAAMHSHITGVLATVAGRGVGAALKWHQRQWSLERGLSRITWTFDPLVARNAYFNLTVLGARPESYDVDFYGPMDDGPNRGQPTDRVQVGWDLAGPAAVRAATAAADPGMRSAGTDLDVLLAAGAAVVLSVGEDGSPAAGRPPASPDAVVLVGLPRDIEAMRRSDPALALAWRLQSRAALEPLIADKSWQVRGFVRSGWYVVERRQPPVVAGSVQGADG